MTIRDPAGRDVTPNCRWFDFDSGRARLLIRDELGRVVAINGRPQTEDIEGCTVELKPDADPEARAQLELMEAGEPWRPVPEARRAQQ